LPEELEMVVVFTFGTVLTYHLKSGIYLVTVSDLNVGVNQKQRQQLSLVLTLHHVFVMKMLRLKVSEINEI
jgi:hypothetical protein